nr:hypothetical protein [Tanacetum cinerariifolium]
MDDLELDNELVDTPLVSPFLDSDDDSDDREVLNELEEYGNAGKLCLKKPSQPILLEKDNNSRVFSYYTTTVRYFTKEVIKHGVFTMTASKIKEEMRTLRARLISLEGENILLHARVRAVELSDDSTQVALQTVRTGLAEMRLQVKDTAERL